jgi:hypothetical protein
VGTMNWTYTPKQAVSPQLRAAQDAINAAYADKGLTHSSAWAGSMAQAVGSDAQRSLDEQRRDREFGTQAAMTLWEKINSAELQKKSLNRKYKTRFPKDYRMFSDLVAQRYLPPKAGTGPIGDSNTEYVPRYDGNMGDTDAGRELDANIANQRALRALEQQRFAFEKSKYAQEQAATKGSVWAQVMDAIMGVRDRNLTPVQIGVGASGQPIMGQNPNAMLPSQVVSWLNTGLLKPAGLGNLDEMAAAGNPQAIDAMRLLFPQHSAQNVPDSSFSGWLSNYTKTLSDGGASRPAVAGIPTTSAPPGNYGEIRGGFNPAAWTTSNGTQFTDPDRALLFSAMRKSATGERPATLYDARDYMMNPVGQTNAERVVGWPFRMASAVGANAGIGMSSFAKWLGQR